MAVFTVLVSVGAAFDFEVQAHTMGQNAGRECERQWLTSDRNFKFVLVGGFDYVKHVLPIGILRL
jgi:hypothetical protein